MMKIRQNDYVLINADKLRLWYKLLKKTGLNTKGFVREEIKNILEEETNGIKNQVNDDSKF